eukprot:4288520-Amphidinium_carterae.1
MGLQCCWDSSFVTFGDVGLWGLFSFSASRRVLGNLFPAKQQPIWEPRLRNVGNNKSWHDLPGYSTERIIHM